MEDKLLALLNMRGRHRHKWDFLRAVLADKVVYDDNAFRVWYSPGSNGCGLLYATKQAQVQNMDKPAGVAQRVTRPDGTAVVQVGSLDDDSNELIGLLHCCVLARAAVVPSTACRRQPPTHVPACRGRPAASARMIAAGSA